MQFKIISPPTAGLFVTFLAGAGSGAIMQLLVPPALTATTPTTQAEVNRSPALLLANDNDCGKNRGQQESTDNYEGQGGEAGGNEGEGVGVGGAD